jgi:hypothetical protein
MPQQFVAAQTSRDTRQVPRNAHPCNRTYGLLLCVTPGGQGLFGGEDGRVVTDTRCANANFEEPGYGRAFRIVIPRG